MKCEIIISVAAWNALYVLAQEYLHKGGNSLGIVNADLEEAVTALGEADRIVRADNEEEE